MIQKATSGPLQGWPVLPLDIHKFVAFMAWCVSRRMQYLMGAKCTNPGTLPPHFVDEHDNTVNASDCSGWVRAALAYATGDETIMDRMPDGSFLEADWFRDHELKRTDYANCRWHDNVVRVAIHRPKGRGGDPIGHIWIVVNGVVYQCSGGQGPNTTQAWDHWWLVEHVDECYCLAAF